MTFKESRFVYACFEESLDDEIVIGGGFVALSQRASFASMTRENSSPLAPPTVQWPSIDPIH